MKQIIINVDTILIKRLILIFLSIIFTSIILTYNTQDKIIIYAMSFVSGMSNACILILTFCLLTIKFNLQQHIN